MTVVVGVLRVIWGGVSRGRADRHGSASDTVIFGGDKHVNANEFRLTPIGADRPDQGQPFFFSLCSALQRITNRAGTRNSVSTSKTYAQLSPVLLSTSCRAT